MDDTTMTAFWLLLGCAVGLLALAATAVIENVPAVTERYDRLVRRVRGW